MGTLKASVDVWWQGTRTLGRGGGRARIVKGLLVWKKRGRYGGSRPQGTEYREGKLKDRGGKGSQPLKRKHQHRASPGGTGGDGLNRTTIQKKDEKDGAYWFRGCGRKKGAGVCDEGAMWEGVRGWEGRGKTEVKEHNQKYSPQEKQKACIEREQ